MKKLMSVLCGFFLMGAAALLCSCALEVEFLKELRENNKTVSYKAGLYNKAPEDIKGTDTPIDLSKTMGEDILSKAIQHIYQYPGVYTLFIDKDIETRPQYLPPGMHLTIIGLGGQRTISATGFSEGFVLFNINDENTSLCLGKNIVLTDKSLFVKPFPLVTINNGTFKMLDGSEISGCNLYCPSIVMLSGTTARFEMSGGVINNNHVPSEGNYYNACVFVELGHLSMTGGVISGNTHSDVLIAPNSFLTISGNAEIGILALKFPTIYSTGQPRIYIPSSFTGSVNTLNLTGDFNKLDDFVSKWINPPLKPFIFGIESKPGDPPYSLTYNDLDRFTLGNFRFSNGDSQKIRGNPEYQLGLSDGINASINSAGLFALTPGLYKKSPPILPGDMPIPGFLGIEFLDTVIDFINLGHAEYTYLMGGGAIWDVPTTLSMNQPNVKLTLMGLGGIKTIKITGPETLFSLEEDNVKLTLDRNITLTSDLMSGRSTSLVQISNGTFTMREGSKITGHSSDFSAVWLSGSPAGTSVKANFIMEGGEISNNHCTNIFIGAAGGVDASWFCNFSMSGGRIKGNTSAYKVERSPADVSFIGIGGTCTLSGNAEIGDFILGKVDINALWTGLIAEFPKPKTNFSIVIDNAFTGSVDTLNLYGIAIDGMGPQSAVDLWKDSDVIKAGTAYTLKKDDISDFTLGEFRTKFLDSSKPPQMQPITGNSAPIPNYKLVLEKNAGKLVVDTAPVKPALTGSVSINNLAPQVEDTLTATLSECNGTGTASWQWMRADLPGGPYELIGGATLNTYFITPADLGKVLQVRVSYSDNSGTLISEPTGYVGSTAAILPGLYNKAFSEILPGELPYMANSLEGVLYNFPSLPGNFTYVTNVNETILGSHSIKPGVNLTLVGIGGERTITFNGPANLFIINANDASLTLGPNITIKGNKGGGAFPLIIVNSGRFVMLQGSKIIDHGATAVVVSKALDALYAEFFMHGGEISGNSTNTSSGNSVGGVEIYSGVFSMSGGKITGNTSMYKPYTPADVSCNCTDNGGFLTLSGAAEIDSLILKKQYPAGGGVFVYIDGPPPFNGKVNKLHLMVDVVLGLDKVKEVWVYNFNLTPVICPTPSYSLPFSDSEKGKFTLGEFRDGAAAYLEIKPPYYLDLEVGALVLREAAGP